MALTIYSKIGKIPNGLKFLNEIRNSYDQSVVDAIKKSGLRFYITLNPMPELVFQKGGRYRHWNYKISCKKAQKGRIVGFKADLVSVLENKSGDEKHIDGFHPDYRVIGIHCDHPDINPDTYKRGKKEGRLYLAIEHISLEKLAGEELKK